MSVSIQLFPRLRRRRAEAESTDYPGDEFFANLQSRAFKPAGLPNFDLLETLDERLNDPPPATPPRASQAQAEVPRGARFTLRVPLGEDMLGQMYEAWDATLGRTVAVKTVQLHVNNPARALLDDLFLQEAQAAARLTHPHIVKVHHVGLSAHGVYIAMERLHGGDLQRALDEGWRASTAQAVLLVRRVADALAYAHARGVLHCNIKPANIFVLPDGRPKVMNFGMARAAHGTNIPELDGLALGSPHYLSPEQLQGGEVDARTDIHALGVMLYELLTGSRAFPGHTVSQIAAALLHHQPVPAQTAQPGLPPALVAIVARAMARHPTERYQKASEMAQALRNWSDSVEAGSGRASRRKTARDDEQAEAEAEAQSDAQNKLAAASDEGPHTSDAPPPPAAAPTTLGVGFVVAADSRKGSGRGKSFSKHHKHSSRDPVVTAPVELSPPPPKRPLVGRLSTQLLVGGLVLAAFASAGLSLREQVRARLAVPEVAVAPELTTFPSSVAAPAPESVVPLLPEVTLTPAPAPASPALPPPAPEVSAVAAAPVVALAPALSPPTAPPQAPPAPTTAPVAALPSEVAIAGPKGKVQKAPAKESVNDLPKAAAKVAAAGTAATAVTFKPAAAIAAPEPVSGAPARKTAVAAAVPAPATEVGPSAGDGRDAARPDARPDARTDPRAAARTDAPAAKAALLTGTVRLAISPWGQVDVDGTPAGTSPPLTRLNLSEGKHTITVRNDDAPPYTVTVHVTADEPVTVRHRFGP